MHVLERLALKKTANESIFTQIREEFEEKRVAERCNNMVDLSSKGKRVLSSDSDGRSSIVEDEESIVEDDHDESSIAVSKQSEEGQNDQDNDSPKTKKVKSEKKTVIRKNDKLTSSNCYYG